MFTLVFVGEKKKERLCKSSPVHPLARARQEEDTGRHKRQHIVCGNEAGPKSWKNSRTFEWAPQTWPTFRVGCAYGLEESGLIRVNDQSEVPCRLERASHGAQHQRQVELHREVSDLKRLLPTTGTASSQCHFLVCLACTVSSCRGSGGVSSM